MNENPYSTPTSAVVEPKEPIAFDLHEPRAVRAGHGANWVAEGFELFKKRVGTWILICIVFIVVGMIIGAISNVASFASLLSGLLTYVWIGGLMLGCRSLETDDVLSVSHLFAGFQNKLGPLILIGLIMSTLGLLVGFASFGSNYFLLIGLTGTEEEVLEFTNSFMTNPIENFVLPLLISLLFYLPLLMVVWFAPPLIVLHDVPVFKAMGLSFKGCLKNIIPFLIYSLVFLLLIILTPLTLFLGFLVLVPLGFTSLYCSYKDIYIDTE